MPRYIALRLGLLTAMAAGCGEPPPEFGYPDIRLSTFGARPTFTVNVVDYARFDARPEAWSFVEYPELTPVDGEFFVEPISGGYEVVLVTPTPVDYSRWHAVLYEGDASSMSNGWRWAPSHWIWRLGPPPPVQPRLFALQEGFVQLTGKMSRPTDTSAFSIIVDSEAECTPEFRLPDVRSVHFSCTPDIVPPVRVTIEFREGLEDDEGVPIPPGTFSVDLVGNYASFAVPGPPPIPAEHCAEGYNYPATDTNCRN